MEWEEAIALTDELSPYIGQILDAAFSNAQAIVVLFTGDDEAQLREAFRGADEEDFERRLTRQARLNVIFEAGMAMGRSPKRTVMVQIGRERLRPFSDAAGRHMVRFSSGSPEERQKLVSRLKVAGQPGPTPS
jgi:predicted nucleotide-binding protein